MCGWPEFHSISKQMQMTQTFRDEVDDSKQHILRMPCPTTVSFKPRTEMPVLHVGLILAMETEEV